MNKLKANLEINVVLEKYNVDHNFLLTRVSINKKNVDCWFRNGNIIAHRIMSLDDYNKLSLAIDKLVKALSMELLNQVADEEPRYCITCDSVVSINCNHGSGLMNY
jgi:hypothetical protein